MLKENLLMLREERGLSREQLAGIVGCSPETIARYERGDRDPKQNMIRKLAAALRVSVGHLMGSGEPELKENVSNVGRRYPAVRVPVLGRINSVCCGLGFDLSDVETDIINYEYIPEEWVSGRIQEPYPIYLVGVEGDSMEPLIMDEERILVNPNETEPPHGGISLVKWRDRVFVRGVFFENNGVRLRAYNPSYRDEFIEDDSGEELDFCGMVLRKIPKTIPIRGML